MQYNVAVLGGGTAGGRAAVFVAKAGLKTFRDGCRLSRAEVLNLEFTGAGRAGTRAW